MALDQTTFKQDIKDIFLDTFKNGSSGTTEEAIDKIADLLSTRINEEISKITITIPSGLVVVVGTATTQSNVSPINM